MVMCARGSQDPVKRVKHFPFLKVAVGFLYSKKAYCLIVDSSSEVDHIHMKVSFRKSVNVVGENAKKTQLGGLLARDVIVAPRYVIKNVVLEILSPFRMSVEKSGVC